MSAPTIRVARVLLDDVLFHPHNVRRDLGDLRSLSESIRRFGVMQPVVVEDNGDSLRLRAGHRRCAAARLAGLTRVPAVIHSDVLDDDEWLLASLAENLQRRGLDAQELRRTADRLLGLGCTRKGIADACGVSEATVARWLRDAPATATTAPERPQGRKSVTASVLRQFVDAWADAGAAPAVLDGLEALLTGEPIAQAMPPGWTPPAMNRSGSKGMRLDLEKVEALVGQGRSASQIADQLGVTARTIERAKAVLRGAA